jgi:hypothetical protein
MFSCLLYLWEQLSTKLATSTNQPGYTRSPGGGGGGGGGGGDQTIEAPMSSIGRVPLLP